MNIHLIIVHFPIALLTLYTLFEVFGFKRVRRLASWFYIKLVMLWVGFLGAWAALASGEVAEDIIGGSPVVSAHEAWAGGATWIYGVLVVIYLMEVFRRHGNLIPVQVRRLFDRVDVLKSLRWLINRFISKFLGVGLPWFFCRYWDF